MANLKKKLSLVTGLCILIAFCLAVAASAQDKTGSVFSPASYECTVTVSEGASVNGAEKIETAAFTEVLLSAPSKKGDERFLYWKDATTQAIVATSRRAYARVYDDTEYVAVYGDPATDEALNGASTSAFLVVTGETKYLYVSRYVPSDATVVAYGVVYSLVEGTDLADKTVDDVDGETVKLKRHETSAARISTVGYTAEADAVAYRPFVSVRDASGTETVVYGDAVSFTACEDTAHGTALENVRKDTSTCSVKGTVYYDCGVCGYRYEKAAETVNDKAHLWRKVEERAATCTEAGNNEHKQCAYCGKTDKEEGEILLEKLPHNYKSFEAKAATCTEAGWLAHRECKTCGHVAGLETDDAINATVAKMEHTMVSVEARPATCSKAGYNAHTACSVCGYSEDREDEAKLTHEFGDAYDVPASYRDGAYSAKDCKNCGYCQKTYNEDEPKLSYTQSVSASGQEYSFDVTVEDTGVYELALKLTKVPAADGYTSVYAKKGYGSLLRIGGSEQDADGYSLYCFYVYLEAGKNTVFVEGQATMAASAVKLTYVTDAVGSMTETFESITKLEASKEYSITNGKIKTSSIKEDRNVRYGILQLRTGDKVTYTLNVAAETEYRIAMISNNDQFEMTLTDAAGNTVTLDKTSFSSANEDCKKAGTRSALLWLSNAEYTLSAGTYTVTFTAKQNFILGGIYFSDGEVAIN